MATIPKLTEQTSLINAIKGNSVMALADNFQGSPAVLKQKFVDMSVAQTNSVMKAIDDTLVANINTELTALGNADTTLQENITSEANTRASADTTNANAIAQEISDRASADSTLQESIDTLTTNLASETSNRTSADNTLQTNINNEALARQEADALLVLKEAGKSLIADAEIARLALVDNYDDTTIKSRVSAVETNKADLVDGKIPATQIPGSYDDVIEGYLHNNAFYFDASYQTLLTAYTGKLYVDLLTNLVYRYSGSAYIATNPQLALGETSATAYRGDRGKLAYEFSQSHTNPTKVSQLENDSGFTDLTLGTTASQAYYGDLGNIAYEFSQNHTNPIETIKVNGVALTPTSKAVDITITPYDNTSNDTRLTALETTVSGIETLLGGI